MGAVTQTEQVAEGIGAAIGRVLCMRARSAARTAVRNYKGMGRPRSGAVSLETARRNHLCSLQLTQLLNCA